MFCCDVCGMIKPEISYDICAVLFQVLPGLELRVRPSSLLRDTESPVKVVTSLRGEIRASVPETWSRLGLHNVANGKCLTASWTNLGSS